MESFDNELNKYFEIFRHELICDILPYWMEYGIGREGDGFWGAVDLKGNPVTDAPKSCVLNARILWTFSLAAIRWKDQQYTDMADRAFQVLKKYFEDGQYGGYWMSITSDNQPHERIKHTYVQAFVLYAFSMYYELKKDPELLKELNKYFQLQKLSWSFIDQHVIDHENGEWFTKVNRLGVPFLKEPPGDPSPYYRNDWKIDLWRCPYHKGRSMMELMARIENISCH